MHFYFHINKSGSARPRNDHETRRLQPECSGGDRSSSCLRVGEVVSAEALCVRELHF